MPKAHPTHCTGVTSASQLQAQWDHLERSLPAVPCSSLAAPWHSQTLLVHSSSVLVYHQSLTSQMATAKQHTEQIFLLSFTIPVPVTIGQHLEGGHRGLSHLLARTAWPVQLQLHPTDQAPINCWSALDRLLERAFSRLFFIWTEPSVLFSVRQSTASRWTGPKLKHSWTYSKSISVKPNSCGSSCGSQVLLQFRSIVGQDSTTVSTARTQKEVQDPAAQRTDKQYPVEGKQLSLIPQITIIIHKLKIHLCEFVAHRIIVCNAILEVTITKCLKPVISSDRILSSTCNNTFYPPKLSYSILCFHCLSQNPSGVVDLEWEESHKTDDTS